MTYAPESIKAVRALLKGQDGDLDDVELGIVGGPSHIRQGTSYHLGADQLTMSKNPYSARTVRDRSGLSNASSALDIDDDLDELRALSVWLVEQCRAGAVDTTDIREIIYSPDGDTVLRWDRERGVNSAPVPDSDLSHRTHTHVSWYRDSEHRDKTAAFKRFFEGDDDMEQYDQNAIRYTDNRLAALTAGLDTVPGTTQAPQARDQAVWPVQVLKRLDAAVAELQARPPVQSAPVDVEALAAVLDAHMEAAAERAVRRVLGQLDREPGS